MKTGALRIVGALVCAAFSVILLPRVALGTPEIINLGVLPGGASSSAYSTNLDGTVIVGQSNSRAFRWTQTGGIQDLGVLAGSTFSSALAVYADGATVLGYSAEGIYPRGIQWTQAGGMQSIGLLAGGTYLLPEGSSSDGRFLTGTSDSLHAFLWTQETGLQDLGPSDGWTNLEGRAVSLDGSTIMGRGTYLGNSRAFRRTEEGFAVLPFLPGHTYAEGRTISDDGQVMFGFSGPSTNQFHAMRWTVSGDPQDLGVLPGGTKSTIERTCSTGSVAVGKSNSSNGDRATLWRADIGYVDLNAYLPTLGVNLSGWVLNFAWAISADGTTIAGAGQFNGQSRAFVVRGLTGLCIPALISSPFPSIRCDGTNGSFGVSAGGDGLTYQWQIQVSPGVWTNLTTHAQDIPCNHAFATLPHSAGTQIGADAISCTGESAYQVRCVISNANGSVISDSATLTYNRVGTGDVDGNGSVDGRDIQGFVGAMLGLSQLPSFARCASDMNNDETVNLSDVGPFTQQLLGL